jgi:voltage-gated potassium channel
MAKLPIAALTSSLFRSLKRAWPQVPLGLLLLFTGAANALTGLQIHGFNIVYQILANVTPLSELNQEVSLGVLGSGVQVLLGVGILATSIGLFWQLRSAWAYSILFLIIALAVDFFSHRSIYDLLLPGLALVALIIWESRFDHRSQIGGYLMSFIGVLAVFAYGVFGSLLLGGMFQPSIHDPYTALYFTVVTLSTVGSKIYPAAPEAEIFMVTLILGGISIFTTTIVTTLGPLLSNQVNPILSGRKFKLEANARVVLTGASSFARSIALELASHKINFVQVVASEDLPPLSEQPTVRGDPSDEAVLKQAGVLYANAVVVAGEDDSANASAATTAKKLNRDAHVIVVASSLQAISRLRSAQADLIFAPTAVAARLLTNLIRGASIPRELQDLFEST